VKGSFSEIVLAKNDFLVTCGKRCRHLYFLQQGALRGYYTLEEKEITHWFGFENDFRVTHGKRCRHLYFLQQGALRGYYTLEEKEITHWFAFENDFVTSFHSFITGQPAVENIQLLQGSVLWSMSREKLNVLLDRFPEIERLVRIIYENYYIRLEERFIN